MNCILLKKSAMTRPLPSNPEPTADPGEYALIDNEDGTLTLAMLNSHRDPSPIDPDAATLTVQSSDPRTVRVDRISEFTWRESLAQGEDRGGPGAVVDISAVLKWVKTKTSTVGGGTGGTHTVTWRDTVVADSTGVRPTIHRSSVNVTQP